MDEIARNRTFFASKNSIVSNGSRFYLGRVWVKKFRGAQLLFPRPYFLAKSDRQKIC